MNKAFTRELIEGSNQSRRWQRVHFLAESACSVCTYVQVEQYGTMERTAVRLDGMRHALESYGFFPAFDQEAPNDRLIVSARHVEEAGT